MSVHAYEAGGDDSAGRGHAAPQGGAPGKRTRTESRAAQGHPPAATTLTPTEHADGAAAAHAPVAPVDDPFAFHLAPGASAGQADAASRFDFALGGSAVGVAALVAEQPPEQAAVLIARAHKLRGERFVFDVYKALLIETGHLGSFSWSTALASLMARHTEGSRAVMQSVLEAEPEHRGPILAALDDLGLLDNLLSPLPFAQVEYLHDHIIAHASRSGGAHVLSKMRPYFENKDRSDHSVSHYLGKVPGVGGALNAVANGLTFGFVGQHDAAYRQKRAGLITEEEYEDATAHAINRAAVVGVVSVATGGAAGAYAEGVTGGIAALGTGGRIAASTMVGAAAGGAGGFGAQLGGDAYDGKVSSVGTYAESVGMGALTGAAMGGTGSAILESLPAGAREFLARKLPKFPDVFDHWKKVGERHALTIKAARLHELIADGAGAWGQPQALAVAGSLAPDVPVRITAELTEHGISVLKAERLADGAEGNLFDDYGAGATYADDAADWRPTEHETASELPPGLQDDRLDVVEKPAKNTTSDRPTWQESERQVSNDLGADFTDQKSFLNGEEVTRGTPGSTRPDSYSASHRLSVDVKNYGIRSGGGQARLVKNVVAQMEQRAVHLPPNTRQGVVLDARGQSFRPGVLDGLRAQLVREGGGLINPDDIVFLTE